MDRKCGDCSLCCKLLPMTSDLRVHAEARETAFHMIEMGLLSEEEFFSGIKDFDKAAGEKCPYQKHGKGCTIYNRRPFGCRIWNCRWLVNDDTAEMSRPDRCHYVIDIAPDFVETDAGHTIPVIQVWVDKGYRDAYKDVALREYLKRRSSEGYSALIRFDHAYDCLFLHWDGKQWLEKSETIMHPRQHTALEKVQALGQHKIVLT